MAGPNCARVDPGGAIVGGFLNCLCFLQFACYDQKLLRGVAQLGSAPLWGSGGRGFESRRSD